MDPVTHTLVGANLAETGLKQRTALGTATLLLAANAPDIDVLSYLAGPSTALWFRRGATHGVLAWLVLPLVVTGVMLAWDRLVRRRGGRAPDRAVLPGQLVLLALIGVATHPLLDLLNTYGIRLLMPFSETWFYGDTLFIVDPWVWAALTAGWLLARRRGAAARDGRPARWALVAVAAYVGFMALSNVAARAIVRRAVAGDLQPERLMVAPMPATPFRRLVVFEGGGTIYRGRFDWLSVPRFELEQYRHPVHPASPAAAVATRGPEVRKFLSWARFPFSEVGATGDGVVVHVGDARYTVDPADSWAGVSVTVER
jgi:inner membrane protein